MHSSRTLPRLFAAACLALASATALAAPPSDAEIDRLLKASRAQSMLGAILPQMEEMQRQQFAQITAGKELDAKQRAEVERIQARTSEIVRKTLAWEEMHPVYVQVYKQTFSSDDVKAMAKFYESRAGQNLLDKTPLLMQNLMGAIQQKMIPMMEALQAELKDVSAQEAPPETPKTPARRKRK